VTKGASLRLSPSRSKIIVHTTPELHGRFYKLKKRTERLYRRVLNNAEFLAMLLDSYEEALRVEEVRKKLIVY
jgi:hypothetical protein